MARGGLLTVGYEGRTLEMLVETLLDEDVEVLVDVRLNAISRKPGLSKSALSAALARAGIEYIHLPELGNPKDNRNGFRERDPESRQRFRGLLRRAGSERALLLVGDLARERRVALLCFEREHTECHREVVGAAVHRRSPELTLAHA